MLTDHINNVSLTPSYSIHDVTSDDLITCYEIIDDCIRYGKYEFTQVLVAAGQKYGKDRLKQLLPSLKSAYFGFAVVTDNEHFLKMDSIESVRNYTAVDLEKLEIPIYQHITIAGAKRQGIKFPPNWTKENSERFNHTVLKGCTFSSYLDKLEDGEDEEDSSISLEGLYWMILEMYDWVRKYKNEELKTLLSDTKFESPEDVYLILKSLTPKKTLYYIGHKWNPEVDKLKELFHRWNNNPDEEIQREILRVMVAIKKVLQETF